jgi:hypothetical protein
MKHFTRALVAILIFTCLARAQSRRLVRRCPEQNKKVVALINEYQELRERREKLRAGEFDADLSADQGRLHEVLYTLGEELGRPPYTTANITRCLGKPDAIKNHGQMDGLLEIYNREKRIAGQKVVEGRNRQYLIYFWRGWHDFLFFISEDGRIVDHGWWFAYE